MGNKFVIGEFVVLRVIYSALYTVVLVTGDKLENGRWPCIINDTGENVELREEQLFKIDWEGKMVDLSLSKNERYVTNMKDEAVRDELIHLRDKLDELDQDDYFGTQGWEYQFGMGEIMESSEDARIRLNGVVQELQNELNCIKNSLPLLPVEIRAHIGTWKDRFFYIEAVSVEHAIWLAKRQIVDLGTTPFIITSIEIHG